jgi:hypothetical protein
MRLVRAEFLKLYRRTGFVLAALGVTVGPALLMHAIDGSPFGDLFGVLALLAVVVGIMVGSSLGTFDESSGVFRELVATGRPRLDLFAARVPAGLVLVLLAAEAGYVVLAAGEQGLVLAYAGWLAVVAAVSFALSLGVASLVGSAAQSMAILLALWLIVTPLAQSAESLDWLADGLVITGLDRIMPSGLIEGDPVHALTLAEAIAGMLAWSVVPLLAGAWRTMTRDA